MTNTIIAQTIFINLFEKIKAEKENQLQEFITSVNAAKEIKELTGKWYYNDLIPRSRNGYNWELQEVKDYLIKRKTAATQKDIAKKLTHLQEVEKSEDFESIRVSVEWKKSRMWGNNPTAEIRVIFKDGTCNWYKSGSIGGCGYDKESTAIAEAINKSNSVLKAFYQFKELLPNLKNNDVLGYGSGYGILPRLEGGVGVSCYPRIFEKLGYTWQNAASGKTFDVYTVTKIK